MVTKCWDSSQPITGSANGVVWQDVPDILRPTTKFIFHQSQACTTLCECTWQTDHRRRRRLPRWRRSKGAIYETVKHGGRQKKRNSSNDERAQVVKSRGNVPVEEPGTTTTVREDLILESAFPIQWQRHAALWAKLAEVMCSQFISLWLAAGNWDGRLLVIKQTESWWICPFPSWLQAASVTSWRAGKGSRRGTVNWLWSKFIYSDADVDLILPRGVVQNNCFIKA